MKLSDFKGEKAITVFADLLAPVSEILADEEVATGLKNGSPKILVIQTALKNHPKAIIKIMALLDDCDVESYEVNLATIPMKLVEVLNDEMFTELFTSQGQN